MTKMPVFKVCTCFSFHFQSNQLSNLKECLYSNMAANIDSDSDSDTTVSMYCILSLFRQSTALEVS